jgi:hypothetical protein
MSDTNNTPAPAAVPAGYMANAHGALVPLAKIKPIDLLRDQLVRDLVGRAEGLNAALRAFKTATFTDIAAFVGTSAEQYGVAIGGDKGNVTLSSFDGQYKIVRQVQESIAFDERLQAAKALIDECITEWSAGSSDEIKVLVQDAFKVDKEGLVNTGRVLGLRRLEITHPKWQRAMDAVSDSLQVVGSRAYVRIYKRVGDTNRYEAMPLDLASV